jgi:hypothetical protein
MWQVKFEWPDGRTKVFRVPGKRSAYPGTVYDHVMAYRYTAESITAISDRAQLMAIIWAADTP